MYYTQKCDGIKAIVFTLDGGLLDLNSVRYRVYSSLCKPYGFKIYQNAFAAQLGNMQTMYKDSPLLQYYSYKDLNNKIENQVFEAVKNQPYIKNHGVDEIIQFCHQRDILVCVYTTHKTKRAMQYLQMSGLFKEVDFIIGADSSIKPLPDSDALMTIAAQLHIEPADMMVIANFESMVKAANQLYCNVIYVPDLTEVTDNLKGRCYRTAQNFLDLLNVFLFSKYEEFNMYSQILGMNEHMSLKELEYARNELLEKYNNDEQLIKLVEETYEYFKEIISKEIVMNSLNEEEMIEEPVEEIVEEIVQEEVLPEEDYRQLIVSPMGYTSPVSEKVVPEPVVSTNDDDYVSIITSPLGDDIPVEVRQEPEQPILSVDENEKEEIHQLIDDINGIEDQEEIEVEENKENEDDDSDKMIGFYNLISSILLSILILLSGILVRILTESYVHQETIRTIVLKVIDGYYQFMLQLYEMLCELLPVLYIDRYGIFIFAGLINAFVIYVIQTIVSHFSKK